jgi:hypothetical protein
VPPTFAFDAWHTLTETSTGTSFEYFIDGTLVLTQATAAGDDLMNAMIQGYNFGQSVAYSIYWDNLTATAIPEPAAMTALVAVAALGLAGWRRRRS